MPDEQVFEWRGHLDPVDFARDVFLVCMAYNQALACIDAWGFGLGTQTMLMHNFQYQNIYRWKHLDSIRNVISNKAGIWATSKYRRLMIGIAIRWLRNGFWTVHSPNFLEEVPFFRKEEEDAKEEAMRGHNDDCVMAGIYAIAGTHEIDPNPKTGKFELPTGPAATPKFRTWRVTCARGHQFECDNPSDPTLRCPIKVADGKCEAIIRSAEHRKEPTGLSGAALIQMGLAPARKVEEIRSFDQF
jgi:hypothetical protein